MLKNNNKWMNKWTRMRNFEENIWWFIPDLNGQRASVGCIRKSPDSTEDNTQDLYKFSKSNTQLSLIKSLL